MVNVKSLLPTNVVNGVKFAENVPVVVGLITELNPHKLGVVQVDAPLEIVAVKVSEVSVMTADKASVLFEFIFLSVDGVTLEICGL